MEGFEYYVKEIGFYIKGNFSYLKFLDYGYNEIYFYRIIEVMGLDREE